MGGVSIQKMGGVSIQKGCLEMWRCSDILQCLCELNTLDELPSKISYVKSSCWVWLSVKKNCCKFSICQTYIGASIFGAPVGSVPPLLKIGTRHVAFIKDNCSRLWDDCGRGLPAGVVGKKVWKVEETSCRKTGKRRRWWQGWQQMQMQVELSATGDKLPNAVVAFLTCEVLSPPASSVQIHFLDEAPELNTLQPGFLSWRTDALKFLGEDWSQGKRESPSCRGLWKVPQKVLSCTAIDQQMQSCFSKISVLWGSSHDCLLDNIGCNSLTLLS